MSSVASSVDLIVFPIHWRLYQLNTKDKIEIHAWCLNQQNETSLLRFKGFHPHVYLELDPKSAWDETIANVKINELKKLIPSLISGKLVHRYRLYGAKELMPENNIPVLELRFNNTVGINRLSYLVRTERKWSWAKAVYETDFDPIKKLMNDYKLNYASWLRVQARTVPDHMAVSDVVEYTCQPNQAKLYDQDLPPPQAMIMSFDIEANSANPKSMPREYLASDKAYLIVCTFQRAGQIKTRKRHVITLFRPDVVDLDGIEGMTNPGDPATCTNPIEKGSVKVHLVDNEINIINTMAELVKQYQPDVITGYYINGFDYKHLNGRLDRQQLKWPDMSRLFRQEIETDKIEWKSAGAGTQHGLTLDIPGRITIDVHTYVSRNFKLRPNNKLETAGKNFLKRGKHPITPQEQFKIYHSATAAIEKIEKELNIKRRELVEIEQLAGIDSEEYDEIDREINKLSNQLDASIKQARYDVTRLIKYCIEDAELVIDLFEKLNILINITINSRVCEVLLTDVVNQGEQRKCRSMMYTKAHEQGYVMTPRPKGTGTYKGALVEEPIVGFHRNIICLDFSSMYPNNDRSHNIDHTTLIPPHVKAAPDFVHSIEDETGTVHRFLKQTTRVGIIPELLDYLLTERSKYKNMMAKYEDGTGNYKVPPEMALTFLLWNVTQDKLKIVANSFYGFQGAVDMNDYSLYEGASSITAIGRRLITEVGDLIKKNYGGRIIYGDTDSCMVDLGIIDGMKCHEMGKKLVDVINKTLPKPMKIAYEKSMNILTLKKKFYMAFLIGKDGQPIEVKEKMIVKGMQSQRRDYCKWSQEIVDECGFQMLKGASLSKIFKLIVTEIQKLFKGQVPLAKFGLTKKYNGTPSETYYINRFVAKLNQEGKVIEPGSTIEYVYVDKLNAKKATDKMVLIDDLNDDDKIDFAYYLEHQLKTSIEILMNVAFGEALSLLAEGGAGYKPNNNRKHFVRIDEPVRMLARMVEDDVDLNCVDGMFEPEFKDGDADDNQVNVIM
jgi:DNA polymerase delta subunit 1